MLKILQTAITATVLASVTIVPGSAAQKNTASLKTLYNFTGNADGGLPEGNVVLGSGGSLFGTTSSGQYGWGGVYELLPPQSGGAWTEQTLYSFTGGVDGALPTSDLIIGKSNVLYGTTQYGGAYGFGTVFQIAPGTGGTWTQKVLYSFKGGTDGANPVSGVVLQSSTGVLYGTTYNGGTLDLGTVYQVGPGAGGTWSEKVLYSFQGGTDGANPIADLVIGPNTTLFGTTAQGGSVTVPAGTPPCAANSTNTPCIYQNWGTAFQVTTKGGGTWTEALLYTFLGLADGGTPESALILGPNNSLYGSTFWGGTPFACPVGGFPQGCGVVFQLTPPTGSGSWTETNLHSFTGVSPDGSHPYKNMVLNVSGVLYGTTYSGGAQTNYCFPQEYSGCGTMFSMKPPTAPGGKWTKSNITVFTGTSGGGPNGLILGTGSTFYGSTVMGGNSNGQGTAWSMTP